MAEEKQDDLTAWSRRLRTSDRSAFTALFHCLYPDLYWYAARLSGSDATADDLVQEAFLQLWEKRQAIDPERSVKAFLYVTVRHRALNQVRDAHNRNELLAQMDTTASFNHPDESVRARMIGRRLQDWIAELPARQREAFELSRFCGLSHREIASVMGLSVNTVEKHITRALHHLRARLCQYDPGLLQP